MTAGPRTAPLWAEHTTQVCRRPCSFLRAGSGPSLVVLGRDNGHPAAEPFLDLLAARFDVCIPFLPGFHRGHPEAWDWLTSPRDLAVVLRALLAEQQLGRFTLVGFGFGGWLAAELATMAGDAVGRLILVGAMGIRPEQGFIFDQFLVSTETYARRGFADLAAFEAAYGSEPPYEQLEAWETGREMVSRIAWKPYMYNPVLPGLLATVRAPALVVWGAEDAVVPAECARLYEAALPTATVEVVPGAGHALDLERPETLAALIARFCA